MTARRKWCLGIAAGLLVLFLILPIILGAALRGTVESRLSAALGSPVKLGGFTLSFVPLRAVLTDLVIGEPLAAAGNEPLAQVKSVDARVTYATAFGGAPHLRELSVNGVEVHLGVGEDGVSTLALFLKRLPRSEKKAGLTLDALFVNGVKVVMHASKSLVAARAAHAPEPAVWEVEHIQFWDLDLPGKENRRAAGDVIGVVGRAPLQGWRAPPSTPEAGPNLEEGVRLEHTNLAFAMPTGPGKPYLLHYVNLSGLRVRDVAPGPNDLRTVKRLLRYAQLCLATGAPAQPAARAPAAWVETLRLSDAQVEACTVDAKGGWPSWRMTDLKVEGQNLAYGPGAESQVDPPGFLKVSSPAKSAQGEGQVTFEWTGVTGSYPRWTWDQKLAVRGLAAPAFSPAVRKGTVAVLLNGPARDGTLDLTGRAMLSRDTELAPEALGASAGQFLLTFATQGAPMPIGVKGTLERPEIVLPSLATNMLENLGSLAGGFLPDNLLGGSGGTLPDPGNLVKDPGGIPEKATKFGGK